MTCIIASKISKNKCIMAGDRRLTTDLAGHYRTDVAPKIRNIAGVLVGGAGDAAVCNLMFMLKELHYFKQSADTEAYFFNIIIPSFRALLFKHGFLIETAEVQGDSPRYDAEFLLCVKGRCFEVTIDRSTVTGVEFALPHAIGCGGPTALLCHTYLTDYRKFDIKPKEALREVMNFTATVNAGCDNNIDFIQE